MKSNSENKKKMFLVGQILLISYICSMELVDPNVIKLDEKKLAKLKTTNQLLDEKYGEHGTPTREDFNEKTMAWYYGEILRDRRKENGH